MAAASVVAMVAGIVLGILAVMEAGVASERWTQTVQAHGRIQLFGFAAPFVTALALEFIPRLTQQPAYPARLRVAIPATLGVGAVLLTASALWPGAFGLLGWPGAATIAAGSALFVYAVALRIRRVHLAHDPQPLYFVAAAAWLLVSSALALWGLAAESDGAFPGDRSIAAAETFLRGFIMLAIGAVALRAFPGHLGLRPVSPTRQLVVLALINGSIIIWLLSFGLGGLPEWEPGIRAGNAAYGVAILVFTVALGVMRPLAEGLTGGPRYRILVPVAWLGAVVFALLVIASAFRPEDLTVYEDGAQRHAFMLGFMLPLMVAMAHIVLARFGVGFVPWEHALTASFVLLVIAWPLRVVPALLGADLTGGGSWPASTAGLLTFAALALVAAVCARVAWLISVASQPHPRRA